MMNFKKMPWNSHLLFQDIFFAVMCFLREQSDKPGYVVNDHLSRPDVATRLKRPT